MKKKLKIILPVVLVLFIANTIRMVFWRPDFTYVGTIEATRIDLSSRLSSVIGNVLVSEGQAVAKGQALVELAAEDLAIAARVARREFERAARLRNAGTISEEVYEQVRARHDEAALKHSWASITSPVGGTVLDSYREAGEWVSPGMKLLTVADLSEVWAIFYVEQPKLVSLSLGMKVTGVLPELGGKDFAGRITRIADEAEFTPKNVQTRAERTRLVYGIKVAFSNKEGILKPGMSIEARL